MLALNFSFLVDLVDSLGNPCEYSHKSYTFWK